jgi:hypothetical protein
MKSTKSTPIPAALVPYAKDPSATLEDMIKPWPNVVSQDEIDDIKDKLRAIQRNAKRLFKDCCEIGHWFNTVSKKLAEQRGYFRSWNKWLAEYFPETSYTTVNQYRTLANNQDFLRSIKSDEMLNQSEALRLIRQRNRMGKPRVRAIVVRADAEPAVLLEAKLKNYVIDLWRLRYLQAEIHGLIEAMELKPDQVLKVLHYVCKEHHEVEEEVLRAFQPKLKVVGKGA